MPRVFAHNSLLLFCIFLLNVVNAALPARAEQPWPFFAFDNAVGRDKGFTPDQQAEILSQLGYQGFGYTGVKNIPEMLRVLEARGLKMFSTYIPVNLNPDETPFDPGLPEAIKQLKGHGTALWIHVHGRRSPANELDDRAVSVIREIADMAAASELPVVLYPHTGFYVATCQDGLRIAKKVDRKNVGTSFNLCHYLKQQDAAKMERVVKESMPHLMLVSINGADSGETQKMGWDRLIQTLDRGSYDVLRLLKVLESGGYAGPIGLQGYAVKGDTRENLKRSINAWRRLIDQL